MSWRERFHWTKGAIGLCLLGTLGLGVWLRWVLAGKVGLGSFSFVHLRHAHSHLGYYGVVFPLLWSMWYLRQRFALSRGWLALYAIGVGLSAVGFARAGYRWDAIAGSTLVLVVWLTSAWKQRSLLRRSADWLAVAPLGIVLGSACIPPIAVFTRRDPGLAAQWVQTFLSTLLFLVALPSTLDRLRLQPPPTLYWLLAGLSGALFLGVFPMRGMGLGLVAMALWLQWCFARQRHLPADIQLLWMLWTVGLIIMGLRLVPNNHPLAIAGLHFTLLGPFLASAWWIHAPHTMSRILRWSYHGFVLAMVASIAAPLYSAAPFWSTLSALAGTGATACALWVTLRVMFARTRSSLP